MTPQEMLERALESSTADESVVLVSESSSANLRWAGNTLTTNGVMQSRDVTVVSIAHRSNGKAAAVVSGSVASAEDVEKLVEQADLSARTSEASPDAAPLIDAGVAQGFSEGPEDTSAEVFSSFAPALGESFARSRAEGRELFGYAEHEVRSVYLGNSAGSRLRHIQPTGQVQLTAKSAQRTRSTWHGAVTRDFADVDMLALDATAAQRLKWAERQIDLEPGRYDVVLPPTAVADLMVYAYWSASARDAEEGRTVYSKPGGGTRVGETLTDKPINLLSDPAYPGLETYPFMATGESSSFTSVFDNGLTLERTNWIDSGVLTHLPQTRHSADLTKMPLTPIIDNLIVDVGDGKGTLDNVVADVERGLLVTTLWYIREVDPQSLLLTGLTRDGVYLIENGEVVGAVNNFRFNESPIDLLKRVTHASETALTLPREWNDFFTRAAMPALRVGDFNMSTVSQAS